MDIFSSFVKENILIKDFLISYLKEDLPLGIDYSSFFLEKTISAQILLKESSVICGLPILKILFEELLDVSINFFVNEGDFIEVKNEPVSICMLKGKANSILKGERLGLNILQKLSGIATLTKLFVDKIKKVSPSTELLNTRKTTPGFRLFEKYACLVGGGKNHRFSLSDGVMIKDNHIKIFGSVSKAIREVKRHIPATLRLEVEVDNKKQIEEIISFKLQNEIDILMLDNFSYESLKEIIPYVRNNFPKTLIEVSGGIDLDTVEKIASLKPDFISTSKTIFAAKAKDYSLEVID